MLVGRPLPPLKIATVPSSHQLLHRHLPQRLARPHRRLLRHLRLLPLRPSLLRLPGRQLLRQRPQRR